MFQYRLGDKQIVGRLKESEAGPDTAELCRKHGISQRTLYRWKAKYGGWTSATRSGCCNWKKRTAS